MTKKKKGTKSSKSKERGDEDFDFSERRNVFKVTENFEPSLNDAFALIESVKTKKGETLLHSMDILFPEGSVTAILGPSGSGKSTLMNTVTHSLQLNTIGVATVKMPGQSTFVPQDDRLHGFFTVKSYMQHYARLSGLQLPKDMLDEKIDKLIGQLGLTNQKNTIVGDLFLKGLSGGQKRRLSIALEALTDPFNFFLDEPTSGLDAESALQVMEFLKSYARDAAGRRVILTIHQPSSFIWSLIDNVVILSKGILMYQGSRENVEKFFTKNGHPTPAGWNPADHYVTMVNDEFRDHAKSVEEWSECYKKWLKSHKLGGENSAAFFFQFDKTASMAFVADLEAVEAKRRSPLGGVWELTYRYFLNLWFNPGILLTRVAMYSMLALMVGALFWDLGNQHDYDSILSRTAVSFYCVAFFIFMSVAVLPFTVMERDIVDKEVRNGYYNPIAYQIAQGLSSIPGVALLAALTSLIIVGLLKFNDPFWYFLIMFLSLLTSEALVQLVSHVVPHFVIGMALVAGLFGFFMLFMGFMIIPSNFPSWLEWTYYTAFHTYSWRSFMVTEFKGEMFPDTPFPTGEDVLTFYEIEDTVRGNDMIVLIFYTAVLHFFSFVVLYVRYAMLNGKMKKKENSSAQNTAS